MKNSGMLRIIGLVIFIGLLGIGSVWGQTNKNTENSPDRNLKGSSRINPSTLAMEFTLPFGSYAGRNGNGVPLSLSYSSKIWHRKSTEPITVDSPGSYPNIYNVTTSYNSLAKFSKRSISGWTSSMQVPAIIKDIELFNQDGVYFPFYEPPDEDGIGLNFIEGDECQSFLIGDPSCPYGIGRTTVCLNNDVPEISSSSCVFSESGGGGGIGPTPTPTPIIITPTPIPQIPHIVPRLRVAMPDGSSVEFRKNDTVINCENSPSLCNGYQEGDYLAVNGSGMRLKIGDTSISNDPNNKNSVLYMPNGSRYVFPDLLQPSTGTFFLQSAYLIDVDGNKTTFDTTNQNWTDTMGKTIQDPLPNPLNLERATIGTKEFTLPGMSNPYKITWKNLLNVNCVDGSETQCADTVLDEESNKSAFQRLSYIGEDTCQTVLTDHPLSPALFHLDTGLQPANGNPAFPNYQYQSKERFCGANPPSQDNGSQPTAKKFNPVVMSKVELPNGKFYEFKYNEYGEITEITYPTGVVEKFTYAQVTSVGSSGDDQTNRGVVERKVISDGVTQTWTYQISRELGSPAIVKTTITTPDLSKTESIQEENLNNAPFGFENPLAGIPKETQTFGSDNRWVSRSLSKNIAETPTGSTIKRDPRPEISVSISFEKEANGTTYKALATMTKNEYDSNADPKYFAHLNLKRTKSYKPLPIEQNDAQTKDLAWFISKFETEGQLINISEMDYLYDPNYQAKGINSLPTDSRLLNPNNPTDILAKSQAVYDETGQYYSMDGGYSSTGYEAPTGTYANYRGHPTTKKTWDKDNNTWIVTHTQFDNFGNVRKVWDTTGDQSRFVETVYDPSYKYAYPTKVKAPAPDPSGTHGMSEGSEINRVYDFTTGLLTSVTDANGQTATTEYDNLLRPIRVNPPAGGSVSETIYHDDNDNDNNYDVWIKSRQQIDEQNWAESTTYYDKLGRAYKSRTKDLQGDVVTETKFDNLGRVIATSNPYRVNPDGTPAETVFWSKPRYDELNRVVETYAPANVNPTNPNEHGASSGTVQFGISTEPNLIGTYTVATDASGRKSRAITGIYGLMRVDEATNKGGTIDQDLGTLASPTQATYYSYNIKGEMTKITQGSQNRYFMYDSLGRLIRVRQPEQTPNPNLATTNNPENNDWTAKYTYDVLGNIVSMTDAKNITITNYYDKASRSISRTYSDGTTPEVNYYYDGKGLPSVPAFSRGAITKVTSSVSEDRFTEFDNHGRLLASQQITDGNTYNFEYKYNLSGGLLEEKYPSGRVVRNFLDNDGGLSQVISKAGNSSQNKQVASNFDYSAVGSVKKMKLGNGLWETAQVNERYQLTQVGLGTTTTNNNLFKIDYEYGELNDDGATVDANKNIGMIAKTTTTIPNTSFVQTFKYDAINRLKEAKEFNPTTPTTNNWIQTFDYDRYGNRIQFNQTVGNTTLAATNITKPTIDSSNNKFTTGQGYVYDYNGNLIQDAEGRTFTFDGNDKQIEVKETNAPANQPSIGRYFYDASGARVKKVTNLETTIFVYDAGGVLAAEYSTQTPNPTPTTSYMTTDHLGSPRVITDKNGNVISRRDFMPFGEEIGVDTVQTSNRSNNSQYATADTVRQKYTGYQKDEETKLDFAEARMYQNKHGRFTAVDPLMASASAMNPQTFNRYSYTGNNPINYTDPSGLKWVMLSDGTFDWKDDNYVLQDGESNLNGEGHLVISGSGCAARKCFSKGNIIIFHANHTITVIKNPTQAQIAIVQGNTVNETVNVSTTPAETIASTHTGSSSGSRTLAPLPCVPGYPCGENAGTGSDAGSTDEELLEVLHTTADVADASEIPVISQIGSLVGMGIDAHRGDYTSVALGAVSMIPVIGAAATYAKVGRRLHRAEEAIDIASDVVRHSPCALCFTAETMVETTDGLKPIEKIEIGDKVLSYNEETKQNEYQVILDTFKRFADDIYSIKIQGEKRALEVTSEHPFYIKVHQARSDLSSEDDEGEWEEVRDLEVGDEIRLASGSWAKILDIKFKGKGQVFNFSVAGNHNYYVGNSRLLTHNTNCPCKWAPGIQNYQAGNMTSIQHVITRHGPNAPTGASKFAGNLTEKKVIKLSKEMFKKGTMLTNGKAIIHDFGRIIGTDKAGNPTQYGVVFLNNAGQARSMFPF